MYLLLVKNLPIVGNFKPPKPPSPQAILSSQGIQSSNHKSRVPAYFQDYQPAAKSCQF